MSLVRVIAHQQHVYARRYGDTGIITPPMHSEAADPETGLSGLINVWAQVGVGTANVD